MDIARLVHYFNLYSEEMVTADGTIQFGMFKGAPRWLPWFLFEREHMMKSRDGTKIYEVNDHERSAFPELEGRKLLAFRVDALTNGFTFWFKNPSDYLSEPG